MNVAELKKNFLELIDSIHNRHLLINLITHSEMKKKHNKWF